MPTLLSEPIQIGKLQLKNRAVTSFNCTNLADLSGAITKKSLNFYNRLAETGPSIIIVEGASVSQKNRQHSRQISLQNQQNATKLSSIAESLRANGCIPALRITHPGVLATTPDRDFRLSPSAISFRGNQDPLGKEMSLSEIQAIISAFVQGAITAWNCGFEIIELQGGDGELLHQFNSPLTNKRCDDFGLNNRNPFKFQLEVVKQIKDCVPDLLLFYRIPMRDYLPGGLTLQLSLKLAQKLAELEIDAFHLTGGTPINQYGVDSIFGKNSPDCVFKDEAIELKKLGLPVVYSGNIYSPKSASTLISNQYADMISFNHALLRSPEFIYTSMQNKKNLKVNSCLRCNDCKVILNACPDGINEGFWTRATQKAEGINQ